MHLYASAMTNSSCMGESTKFPKILNFRNSNLNCYVLLLSTFFKINLFQKFFQEHYQCQTVESRPGPDFGPWGSIKAAKSKVTVIPLTSLVYPHDIDPI